MIKITKHGKFNTFNSMECPECGCCFEYTKDYVEKNGHELKCPECLSVIEINNHPDIELDGEYVCADDENQTTQTAKTIYKRNLALEEDAINDCLESIDFELLAKSCQCLYECLPDYDYFKNNTAESLKATALKELRNCFDRMAIHGYTINYHGGDKVIGFCIDGVFNVDTFYDPEGNDGYWCTCNYPLQEGASY